MSRAQDDVGAGDHRAGTAALGDDRSPEPGREVELTVADTSSAGRWRILRPWIGTAVRLGLAAVWLFAGASKVGDLAASGRAVAAYDVMPYEMAKLVGAALPFVELALGVLLLFGLATRLTAGFSALLLLVFIAGIVSAWARGLAIDCGCFSPGGELAAGESPSYGPEILRDIGFLALAGFLLIWPLSRLSIDSWLAGDPGLEEIDD